MKKTLILTTIVIASLAQSQEAGYTLQVDFESKVVSRAILVPVGKLTGIPLVGTLDVSTLLTVENQLALGVGVGFSRPVGNSLWFNAGISYLDQGGTWKPRFGGYVGFSWNL